MAASKKCPRCGDVVPSEVGVCDACGYSFDNFPGKEKIFNLLSLAERELNLLDEGARRLYIDDEEELEELDFYEYKDAHEYLTRQCEHVQVLLEMIARELV